MVVLPHIAKGARQMSKNLKGKELGSGIYQRKDGLYSARFVDKRGKREERYFPSLQNARKWLDAAKAANWYGNTPVSQTMTVDEWFAYWSEHIVGDLAFNTRRNYSERYIRNIQPVLGKMRLVDVKPLHCKMVLNLMDDRYAGSTIRQTYITMGMIFRSALMNDLITKHPMDGVRYTKPVRAADDIKCLTVEEQQRFLEVAKRSHNYEQYAFLLETGLRTGELIGLTWDAINWEKRTLTVNKTLEYRHSAHGWRAGPPKTLCSYRTIPLTNQAYEILRTLESRRYLRKEADELAQVLEYMDRRTGTKQRMTLRDLVFINFRTGMPNKNSSYDTHLYKLCDEAGIRRFCMHALRHTYATRAIESGMPPKVLQKLLGHSSIKTAMDRYVHATDDSLVSAVQQFERYRIGENRAATG